MDNLTIRHTGQGTMCHECAFKMTLAETRARAQLDASPASTEDGLMLGILLGFSAGCLALLLVLIFSRNSDLKRGALYGMLLQIVLLFLAMIWMR